MRWQDIPRNPSDKTLRQFATAWFVFFVLWAIWFGFRRGNTSLGTVLAVAGVAGGLVGLIQPRALRWIFVGWMVLAFPIGWLVSLIMLVVLFYGIFTPTALLLRLRGRDSLGLKPPAKGTGLWMRKETPLDVRSYFRQY